MSIQILGVSGSLRKSSINSALVRAAGAVDERIVLEIAAIDDLPHYSGDLDTGDKPVAAQRFIDQIAVADGVLIATPEYNYSIPGVLKNAIDWASRPAYRSVFAGKPVAIMSASPSQMGGIRAQAHLRDVLAGMLAETFVHPEFAVFAAHKKFENGELTDEDTRARLATFMESFADRINARREVGGATPT